MKAGPCDLFEDFACVFGYSSLLDILNRRGRQGQRMSSQEAEERILFKILCSLQKIVTHQSVALAQHRSLKPCVNRKLSR